ncbi:MAG: hypothetical protein ACU0CN_13100, partial [Pseudooceanicola nanhaiensis]
MDEIGNLEALETQAEALTLTLGASADMAASFDAELRRVRVSMGEAGKDVATLERGLSRGLRRAFDGVMFDGMKLSDALRTMARSMVGTAYSAAARPVARHFGGLIAGGCAAVSGLPQHRGGLERRGELPRRALDHGACLGARAR